MLNPNIKGVILFFPGPMGGAEKVVLTGVKEIQKKNISFELWIIKEQRSPIAADQFQQACEGLGVSYRIFSCNSQFDIILIRKLRKTFKEESFNFIHSHGFKASFYALFMGSPNFVMTHHGVTGHTLKVKIYERLEQICFKRADTLICVSKKMEKTLSRKKHKKITTIYNPLAISTLHKVIKIENHNELKLAIIGRLSPEKAHTDLIQAIYMAKDNSLKLDIIGDGILKGQLQTEVKSLGLNSQIRFHGFQKDIGTFLKNTDAVIMPSHTEGLPMVLIEACCFGVPILASKVGGIPELVKHEGNGYLFPIRSPKSILETIIMFKRNKEEIKSNAIKAAHTSIVKFSVENWVSEHISIYNTCFNQE